MIHKCHDFNAEINDIVSSEEFSEEISQQNEADIKNSLIEQINEKVTEKLLKMKMLLNIEMFIFH